MSVYIIAEAGVNHNGDLELAREMIDVAMEAGADAVKFQSFRTESLVAQAAETLDYQRRTTGHSDQRAMLKRLEISEEGFRELSERSYSAGIEFLSTPFDIESLQMLQRLGVKRLKISSGEITNWPFLRIVARTGLPVILSTGMANLDEVRQAVGVLCRERPEIKSDNNLSLLHCTSAYPTDPKDVNLSAMATLRNEFNVSVGFSDHTVGIHIPVAAVALGAEIVEKHFTLDRALPGPDHQASVEPDELALMVKSIRDVERSIGNGKKEPRPAELPARNAVRRSIVLASDKPRGALLEEPDLKILRPGYGIHPGKLSDVIGRKVSRALKAGTVLNWSDFE